MSNEIVPQVFDSEEFGTIRAMRGDDGEPWFVLKDVMSALDIHNPTETVKGLDEDEFTTTELTDSMGRDQRSYIVSEAGLYSLVLKSRKPGARRFKRWVTHEVLPALRRDGAYVASDGTEDDATLMARALKAADRALRERDARIAALEPKAGMFDSCMDGGRWSSVTEVSRLLHQYDRSITRSRLFDLMTRDGIITRDRQASKEGIDRGYVVNYQPPACFNQKTGEAMRPKPYAKVTSKGLDWALRRYCGRGVA